MNALQLKLKNFALPLIAALMASAGSAAAVSVTLSSYASPGQYVATPVDPAISNAPWNNLIQYDPKAMVNGGFWTFCLETNQYFDQNGTYNVEFANHTDGGSGLISGSPDPISAGTAYLYERFALGTLFPESSYSTSRGAELQYAIWSLEDEVWSGSPGISTYLEGILTDKFMSATDYKADYTGSDVEVMVLTDSNGGKHQDQLYFHGVSPTTRSVPDGGVSLSLLGISLGGLGFARRFMRA